jgi:hypothetical protein
MERQDNKHQQVAFIKNMMIDYFVISGGGGPKGWVELSFIGGRPMTMSETIAFYVLVFLALLSLVLIIAWGLSITDTSVFACKLSCLAIEGRIRMIELTDLSRPILLA